MLQLYDLVKKGAFVCGNGPITSQYGGTAWAGDLGSIREDTFGLKTSEGVGRKVAQVVKLVNSQETKEESEIRISFWIMQEKNSVMKDTVADIISKASEIIPETFAFDVVDLTSLKIRRCQGCPVCPFYLNQQGEYGVFRDKIQDDDLKDIYDRLINTDGIIICGYNPVSREGVNDIYQIFIERTRQIRRDNFLLTNIPVSAFCLGEPSAGFTFSLKIMTSFLRHNTVILPPIEDFSSHGTVGSETVGKFAKVFLSMASMKQTREKLASNSAVYIPIGYSAG
jgi:multimeric flavodoxin WrbA